MDPAAVDTAYLSYFLPKGEYTVTASYDDKTDSITITRDDAAKIISDVSAKPQRVVYRHNELFIDEVTIAIDQNGLLKQISTSSSNQTIAIITAVGQIAEQFGSLKTALTPPIPPPKKPSEAPPPPAKAPPPPAKCQPMTVQVTAGLTFPNTKDNTAYRQSPEMRGTAETGKICRLTLKLDVEFQNRLDPPVDSLGPPDTLDGDCPASAVCLRVPGGFNVTIRAALEKLPASDAGPKHDTFRNWDKSKCTGYLCVERTASIVAPLAMPLGRLYFNRRAFVDNSANAEFTNGMLTKIYSKNPSAIAQVLQLPIQMLKSLTLFVKI